MRVLVYVLLVAAITSVQSKNNVKPLTESLGQEVIEIGLPSKGLPGDLEEEPSAELEDEEKITSTILTPGTKKETKRTTTIAENFRWKNKELNRTQETRDEEEAKIEKELAEIYKDNIDYKADSSELTKEVKSKNGIENDAKPALRAQHNFKFQPDLNNKAEVERFRTSVDDISCDSRTKMIATELAPTTPDSAATLGHNIIVGAILTSAILYL